MPTFPDIRQDQAAKADPIAVLYLQNALLSQGYQVPVNGKYENLTIGAVHDFQATHLGISGQHLTVDGWVGQSTWWAIQNPSGPAQKSDFEAMLRKGLSSDRRALLRTALKDHAANTREIPDGANYGDGVTRYLEGVGPCYWCCAAVSTWYKDVTGTWPFNKRCLSVADIWQKAKTTGNAVLISTKPVPCPGDAFVFQFRNAKGDFTGMGHIGLVATVSQDGESFNTVEGNCGNRVKVSLRDVHSPVLVGFIDFFGDRQTVLPKVERGLYNQAERADSTAGGTR